MGLVGPLETSVQPISGQGGKREPLDRHWGRTRGERRTWRGNGRRKGLLSTRHTDRVIILHRKPLALLPNCIFHPRDMTLDRRLNCLRKLNEKFKNEKPQANFWCGGKNRTTEGWGSLMCKEFRGGTRRFLGVG